MRKSIITAILIGAVWMSPVKAMQGEYVDPLIVSHPGLGECEFAYHEGVFYISHDGEVKPVNPAYLDKTLRTMDEESLKLFLEAGGYLYVNQLDDGEFTLTAKGRLKGGMIIFGALVLGTFIKDVIFQPARPAFNGPLFADGARYQRIPTRYGIREFFGASRERYPRKPERPREGWAPRPQEPAPTTRMPDRLDNTQTGRNPGPGNMSNHMPPPPPPMDNTPTTKG